MSLRQNTNNNSNLFNINSSFTINEPSTNVKQNMDSFGIITLPPCSLNATNVITTTNASTLYIADAPVAGTNITITNRHAILVDAGLCRSDYPITIRQPFGFYEQTANTTQSIPDNTTTKITFWGVNSSYNVTMSNGSITINTAGFYLITANIRFILLALPDIITLSIRINNTQIAETTYTPLTSGNSLITDLFITTGYQCAANDFIEIFLYHDNTANSAQNINGANYVRFIVLKVL